MNDEPDAGTGRLRLAKTACRFPEGPGAVARLCRDVALLILRWWRAGRIRVSPREGELLRLQPGDLVLFGENRLQIQRRRTVQPANEVEETAIGPHRREHGHAEERPLPVVLLECEDDLRQHWQLRIRLPVAATGGLCGIAAAPAVELSDSTGTVQRLQPGDVTVYLRQSDNQANRAMEDIPQPRND